MTARAIPEGDEAAWQRQWQATAERVEETAGTAKAAADAWALAAALEDARGDVAAALAKWEPSSKLSASLTRRVIAMGDAFQFTNSAKPGDPDLRFGLYGPGQ